MPLFILIIFTIVLMIGTVSWLMYEDCRWKIQEENYKNEYKPRPLEWWEKYFSEEI